ncbi:MAG: GNAT family N-acetyltransferase, partial [Actinomycetota bacterium]|nr:GNAT family N-acetyltransferase [Actinomycetota bacterium]
MAEQAPQTGTPILRRATPDDTGAICALLGAAFPDNPKRHPALYRWQYWDNPFGPSSVWLWEDGGAVVCHGATFATPGVLDGRPVRLGHAADSATAASHRRAGLYARLARARYRDSAQLGMAAVLSLPN